MKSEGNSRFEQICFLFVLPKMRNSPSKSRLFYLSVPEYQSFRRNSLRATHDSQDVAAHDLMDL